MSGVEDYPAYADDEYWSNNPPTEDFQQAWSQEVVTPEGDARAPERRSPVATALLLLSLLLFTFVGCPLIWVLLSHVGDNW